MELIVIEHLEDGISRWMLEEYREAASVAGASGYGVVVANLGRPELAALVGRLGVEALLESGVGEYNRVEAIVLDPQAPRPLEPWEVEASCCLVVGGIMGDHPPRGRTRLVSWRYTNAARRNLGPHQLSIDGAVKVALEVARGRRLGEIPLVVSPRVEVETPLGRVEVELPYAYPALGDGRPWIAPGVLRLLERGIMWDEAS